jgi:uncharacterized repeat protein (TIGR04042 family)
MGARICWTAPRWSPAPTDPPEVQFEVEWPDGSTQSCYSPSLIVEEYFTPGAGYPVAEFVRLSREALGIASDRVRAKYGFPCSLAAASLADIEAAAARFGPAAENAEQAALVTVRGFRR